MQNGTRAYAVQQVNATKTGVLVASGGDEKPLLRPSKAAVDTSAIQLDFVRVRNKLSFEM